MKIKIASFVNKAAAGRNAALVAGCLFACARAQATVTLTFDENGNSTGLSGETYLSSYADSESGSVNSKSEPSGGGASTLTYLAPSGECLVVFRGRIHN
jgi:hypothetical protein